MDKYEYRLNTQEMLSSAAAGDYKKAEAIADSIDWRKVKSVSMLSAVSGIYEECGRYQDAREVLFIAYDRAPTSRKIIFGLSELALKLGNIEEAKDCYDEFRLVAPNDGNQYVLRYEIAKAANEPINNQIKALEGFKSVEYVERWAYELAKLYEKAGMTEKCIEECDDLVLWFSSGKYVHKALELKRKYRPLTGPQLAKYMETSEGMEEEETSEKQRKAEILLDDEKKAMAQEEERLREKERAAQAKAAAKEARETAPVTSVEVSGETPVEEIITPIAEEEPVSEEIQPVKKEKKSFFGKLFGRHRDDEDDFEDEDEEEIDIEEETSEEVVPVIPERQEALENLVEMEQAVEEEVPVIEEAVIAEPEPVVEEPEPVVEEPVTEPEPILEEEPVAEPEPVVEITPAEADAPAESASYAQEEDGQMSLSGLFSSDKEEQISGQMDLADLLSSWEAPEEPIAEPVVAEAPVLETEPVAEEISVEDAPAEEEPIAEPSFDDDILAGIAAALEDNADTTAEKVAEEGIDAVEVEQEEPVLAGPPTEEEANAIEKAAAEEMTPSVQEVSPEVTEVVVEKSPEELLSEEELRAKRVKKALSATQELGLTMDEKFDLEAQARVGLKAGLTEAQKKAFTYFVPVRGMSEQIVEGLHSASEAPLDGTSSRNNLLVIGPKGCGKTMLGLNMIKQIRKEQNASNGKAAIISATSLNRKDIPTIMRKINGGALVIEDAGQLLDHTIRALDIAMMSNTGNLIICLEDSEEAILPILHQNESFSKKFTIRLQIPNFINDELVTFAQAYAKEHGYRIDEMGILALYSRIDVMQKEDHSVTIAEVKEIMDAAFVESKKNSMRKTMTNFFKTKDPNELITLEEYDFVR